MNLQKNSSSRIHKRLIKIHGVDCTLKFVRRINRAQFQRVQKGIVMMIPKYFTLNDVHNALTEIAEVYPWSEDYIHYKKESFICYRKDLALSLALYGFLYKKTKSIPFYQKWGEAIAA